ncbi:hypothetical protein CSKR_101778 [Clonorchis sinensis]|uniref:Uncharacterized protein n=1 Tax=Clonorchis sinensis TaxID=79923 RepID=A0A3R7G9L1_CLOSI|nr:hypothetical protein CSKR_101778 [Clonorchis sinensis]
MEVRTIAQTKLPALCKGVVTLTQCEATSDSGLLSQLSAPYAALGDDSGRARGQSSHTCPKTSNSNLLIRIISIRWQCDLFGFVADDLFEDPAQLHARFGHDPKHPIFGAADAYGFHIAVLHSFQDVTKKAIMHASGPLIPSKLRYGHKETEALASDNGSQFSSSCFQQLCRRSSVTLPHLPQSNGQTERLVGTFKRTLLKSRRKSTSAEVLQGFLV